MAFVGFPRKSVNFFRNISKINRKFCKSGNERLLTILIKQFGNLFYGTT